MYRRPCGAAFFSFDKSFLSPAAGAPPQNKEYSPQAFISRHGAPDADNAQLQTDTQHPAQADSNNPGGQDANGDRKADIPRRLQTADKTDVDGAALL